MTGDANDLDFCRCCAGSGLQWDCGRLLVTYALLSLQKLRWMVIHHAARTQTRQHLESRHDAG